MFHAGDRVRVRRANARPDSYDPLGPCWTSDAYPSMQGEVGLVRQQVGTITHVSINGSIWAFWTVELIPERPGFDFIDEAF